MPDRHVFLFSFTVDGHVRGLVNFGRLQNQNLHTEKKDNVVTGKVRVLDRALSLSESMYLEFDK